MRRAKITQCFLIPTPQLAVDANRDGAITFDDADKTTTDKPYRFWLNDDQDESKSDWKWTEAEPEIYDDNPKLHDLDDRIINSPRDCEDLTRLWLDTGNIMDYLKDAANDLYIGLKWENVGDTKTVHSNVPFCRHQRWAWSYQGCNHCRQTSRSDKSPQYVSGGCRLLPMALTR